MSHPPENPRRPAGSDDGPERRAPSWHSDSFPEGAGQPAAPFPAGTPAGPTQTQPWPAGPTPYQPTRPAPAPTGYPTGYQQPPPPYGLGAPAPRKSSTGRVVAAVLAAVLLVVGGGIAVWQLWPEGKDSPADATAEPTCWDPEITGDCPQFAGREAALYVFPLKDKADEDGCGRLVDFEPWGTTEIVDGYGCRFDDLGIDGRGDKGIILQWHSPEEAADAWATEDGQPVLWFEERWTVDGVEMGDTLGAKEAGSDASVDLYAHCYDDLPFCLLTIGDAGKGGTGEQGDWALVWDEFDPLNAQEVEALNTYLADHPSMATPGPTSTTTGSDDHEITDLNSVERSVQGQLAKGYCFDALPDLGDALNTPTIVETIPCADPHLSQVIGFVDISDIYTSDNLGVQSEYTKRCQGLMSAEDVPEGLQEHATLYYPFQPEVEAGVRVVMCLVHTDTPWTGSALDGTAAGY